MTEVTRILAAIEQGDTRAADELLPVVYDERRRLAASRLARETPGHTLQPTALVHEAYLRLISPDAASWWSGPAARARLKHGAAASSSRSSMQRIDARPRAD